MIGLPTIKKIQKMYFFKVYEPGHCQNEACNMFLRYSDMMLAMLLDPCLGYFFRASISYIFMPLVNFSASIESKC